MDASIGTSGTLMKIRGSETKPEMSWHQNPKTNLHCASSLCKMSPLRSVADPDPGSGAFLTPGSGTGKKSRSGSGMNNPYNISESLETIFWAKKT